MKRNPPKTHEQEILLHLITTGSASCIDFAYLSGFRTRISDLKLKRGLSLRTEQVKQVSKYGNAYSYAKHFLDDRIEGVKLYNQITANNE